MFSRNVSRVVKYGLYGSVGIGGTVAALKYQENELSSLAIVRITRTAITAIDIGRTYQAMLYSQDWDRTSGEYEEIKKAAHQIGAEKLLELCRANKGVYIKIGQHVGAMDYLLPTEYVKTMRILHKNAPENSLEELYTVIREDLHKEPEELFDDFETEPLGIASLAQVHKAKLKDGTVVAVKVQHHFVKKNIKIDLRWMEFCLKTMSKVFPEFQMQWLIEETKKNIQKELDFVEEGHNAEKAGKLFKDYKWLKVPKVFWDYTTERVLVMEYVKGGLVNDVQYIQDNNIDKWDLCKKIGGLYSHMIFITGFVHSDPHPGNILIQKEPDQKEVTVYLLDHGLYAQLTDEFRYNYSKMWLAIIARNREEMRMYTEKLGVRKELYFLFACMVTGRPWESIMQGIAKTKPSPQEKKMFQDEIPNIWHHITECLETVDRQALLVLRTNDLIRSIEYALGLHDKLCGFDVMTKCCITSIYKYELEHASSMIKKPFITLKFGFSLLILYFYSVYHNIMEKLKGNVEYL